MNRLFHRAGDRIPASGGWWGPSFEDWPSAAKQSEAMFPELVTDLLKDGYKVSFNAPGHSMYPTIMANETVVVGPVEPSAVLKGDIVLFRSNGSLVAHRVMGIVKDDKANEYSTLLKSFCPVKGSSATEPIDGGDSHSLTVPDNQSNPPNRPSIPTGREAEEAFGKFSRPRKAFQGPQSRSSIQSPFFILRGDAARTFDEPVTSEQVLGKVIFLERNGKIVNPYSLKHKLSCWAHRWAARLKKYLFFFYNHQ